MCIREQFQNVKTVTPAVTNFTLSNEAEVLYGEIYNELELDLIANAKDFEAGV